MTILVGDIGGTSIRMGVVSSPLSCTVPTMVLQFRTCDFKSLESVVEEYLKQTNQAPVAGVFAVAAPTDGERSVLTNADWTADVFKLTFPAQLLNDLESSAWAVLSKDFTTKEFIVPQVETQESGLTMVVGLGTGFGSALLVPKVPLVLPMEYGHRSFAPVDLEQLGMMQQWFSKNPDSRVTVEDVLSGRGLWTLTQWSANALNVDIPVSWIERQIVIGRILQQNLEHEISQKVWSLFASILGAVCGDVIVSHRLDRVVLSGGVLQKVLPILQEPKHKQLFVDALFHKAPMTKLIQQAAIDVSDIEWMNLVGVATWYAHHGK